MRILLVVEGFNAPVGGAAEVADNLAAQLVALGHSVALVSTRDPAWEDENSERQPPEGVLLTYLKIPMRRPAGLRHLERWVREPLIARRGDLARFIQRWGPQVVSSHAVAWDMFPTVVSACLVNRVPLVQHLYDPRGNGKLGMRALRALRWANGFIALSSSTKRFFEAVVPAASDASVVGGGTDPSIFDHVKPFRGDKPYVLCVSRLELSRRSLEQLIGAFKAATGGYGGVHLLIAGVGPDEAKLRAAIEDHGLNGQVRLLGYVAREQLLALYKGALLFAMPSRGDESWGLAFLEAMAAGKAVVGTITGGVPEVVRHRDNGLLVREDDEEALAEALHWLLSHRAERQMYAERARADADLYRWSRLAAHHLEVYRSLVGRRRKSAAR